MVAAAVPVPVAVYKDLALVVVAAASTAQEVFFSGGDAVGLLAAGCDAAGLLPTGWWGVRLRCLRLWPDADLRRRWWR